MSITISKLMARCICGKTFKTYNGLRSHTYICQLTNDQTNEKTIREIPSQGEQWKMICKLIADNNKLQLEVQQLRNSMLYQQRKIPIMQLLQEKSDPSRIYDDWINDIIITPDMLDIIFKDGQIKGAIFALRSCIERIDEREMFIRAFTHKKDILYIYRKKGWEIMTEETLKNLWHIITRRFIMQFNEWEKDPKIIKLKENYETQDIYLKNFQNTIGLKTNVSVAMNKIQHSIYEYLKCDPIKFVSF